MADHIPNDLLIEILARLPSASLLRFKSVCKPWRSLIRSPSFVTKHLNQSITKSERKGDKHRTILWLLANAVYIDPFMETLVSVEKKRDGELEGLLNLFAMFRF
ncbi:hypothetical protein RHMOL_Rhmol04G0092000 [Rhododendron molle]|uniref:Uncharacterized protein n=1 Tax=Rhododendron molle TaxID=49168 RepID=A0ACC0NYH0_RHOML|nr:hypothetical protein RHMOL_Rhmol04G0092000 [Rhododendron molle]